MTRKLVRMVAVMLIQILILLGGIAMWQREGQAWASPTQFPEEIRMSTHGDSATVCTTVPANTPRAKRAGPRYVTPIGGAVLNHKLRLPSSQPTAGSKQDCRRRKEIGGSAPNIANQLTNLGVTVRPIFLVGADDHLGRQMRTPLLQEFPQAVVLPVLEETAESYTVADGKCYTVRSSVADRQAKLPPLALETVRHAALVLLAPMTPADYAFEVDVLEAGHKVILQLSSQQCEDRELAFDLAQRAWLSVINNDAELQLWVGTRNPQEGIRRILRRGLTNILVTHAGGVDAYIDGKMYKLPRFESNSVRETVGARDRFLATFAGLIAQGQSPADAIKWGLASVALFVEGSAGSGNRRELAAVVARRDTISVSSPSEERPGSRLAVPLAAAAGGVLAALSLWVLLGVGLVG